MKKFISILLTLSVLFTVGCSNTETSTATAAETAETTAETNASDTTSDARFLADFSTVVNDYCSQESSDAEEGTAEYRTYLEDEIQKEKDLLDTYRDMQFEDEQLKEYAATYLDTLNAQKVAFDYYDSDYDSFDSEYTQASQNQLKAMQNIYDNYELAVNEENVNTLERVFTGLYINDHAEEFYNMINAGTLEANENDEGTVDITYTITNTMDHDFTVLTLGTFLVNGESIVDVNVYEANDWKAGEERAFTFTAGVPGDAFDSYFTYWY